jgi:multisubunit Na+/H+ antiporter MnhG subunit
MSDLLSTLCPMFKEEVYRRTTRISNMTLLGAAGLVAGMLWYATWADEFGGLERILCALGVTVFVVALLHQVSREAARHAGAKDALIRIERALGLFEPGRHMPAAALYPEAWMVPPPTSRATRHAKIVLSVIGALFVLEILLTW